MVHSKLKGKIMIKTQSEIEFKVGEKNFRFTCESDSPIDHAKLALSEFWKYLDRIQASQVPKPEIKEEIKEE
jgi:hypothetical protein